MWSSRESNPGLGTDHNQTLHDHSRSNLTAVGGGSRNIPENVTAGSFPGSAVFACSQRTILAVSSASVARLRLLGPVRHFWSRCLCGQASIMQRVQNRTLGRSELKCSWHFWVCAVRSSGRLLGSLLVMEADQSKPICPKMEQSRQWQFIAAAHAIKAQTKIDHMKTTTATRADLSGGLYK